MSNAIEILSSAEKILQRLKTPEDIMPCLNDLKKLENLLKLANIFNEKARQYAELEAATYKKIVDLGFMYKVPAGENRRIVMWFGTYLDDAGRTKVINECSEKGITIKAIWKRDVLKPEQDEYRVKRMTKIGNEAIKEFKDTGKVELEHYFDKIDNAGKQLSSDVVKGYKDKVRDRIRHSGGHGLGDGEGTYLSKEVAGKSVEEIINNKISSIVLDIQRLLEFIGDDIKVELNVDYYKGMSIESAINIAILLLGKCEPRLHGVYGSISKIDFCSYIIGRLLDMSVYDFFEEINRAIKYSDFNPVDIGWPEDWDS